LLPRTGFIVETIERKVRVQLPARIEAAGGYRRDEPAVVHVREI
jgi:hypothetical protein